MTSVKASAALFVLTLLAPGAFAQKDLHFYGGATTGGSYNTGFLGGIGIQPSRFYVAVDGHRLPLKHNPDSHSSGLDGSIGTNLSSWETVSLTPLGVVGITSRTECEVNLIFRTTSCFKDLTPNFGVGLVAAFKRTAFRHPASNPGGSVRYGIHAGFRVTRSYGAALTVGLVLSLR